MSQKCITLEKQPVLFMCGSLIQKPFLRVLMWILGLSASIGNLFVLLWRATTETKNDVQIVQAIFIGNLALSDLLMGIYMLLLAVVDSYYGDEFYRFSDSWRLSLPCRAAGFLALLSSETSLLLLTFITVDRFLCCVFPFSSTHFKKFSAYAVVIASWLMVISMSFPAVVLADSDGDFYSLSDVCIGLPLVTRPESYVVESSTVEGSSNSYTFNIPVTSGLKSSWYFSTSVFLGLNFLLVLVIPILYIMIFIYVLKTRRAAQNTRSLKREVEMALRMTLVVMTNCLTWLPVIVMGILSQSGLISVSLDIYIWSVVVILPINASFNPYLYTISVLISDFKFKKREQKKADRRLNKLRAVKERQTTGTSHQISSKY